MNIYVYCMKAAVCCIRSHAHYAFLVQMRSLWFMQGVNPALLETQHEYRPVSTDTSTVLTAYGTEMVR